VALKLQITTSGASPWREGVAIEERVQHDGQGPDRREFDLNNGLGIEQLGITFTLSDLKTTAAKQVAKALYASLPHGVPSKNQSRRVERT